jgi:hypothetical protein
MARIARVHPRPRRKEERRSARDLGTLVVPREYLGFMLITSARRLVYGLGYSID